MAPKVNIWRQKTSKILETECQAKLGNHNDEWQHVTG